VSLSFARGLCSWKGGNGGFCRWSSLWQQPGRRGFDVSLQAFINITDKQLFSPERNTYIADLYCKEYGLVTAYMDSFFPKTSNNYMLGIGYGLDGGLGLNTRGTIGTLI